MYDGRGGLLLYETNHCESMLWTVRLQIRAVCYFSVCCVSSSENLLLNTLLWLVCKMLLPVILLSADVLRLGKAIKCKEGSYNKP